MGEANCMVFESTGAVLGSSYPPNVAGLTIALRLLMTDHDGTFLDQLAPPLAIDGKGRHAFVDLTGNDRLGQQIAPARCAGDAIAPAGGDPEIPAIRMRAQQ